MPTRRAETPATTPPQHGGQCSASPTTSNNTAAPPAVAYASPASFWHAAHTHITHPDDLERLAEAAEHRHRLQWAHHLNQYAAKQGSAQALTHVAWKRGRAGDREGAEALARQAAELGDIEALVSLAWMREEAGDREGAEALYRQAVEQGDTNAFIRLARMRKEVGDQAWAEAYLREAVDLGDVERHFPGAARPGHQGRGTGLALCYDGPVPPFRQGQPTDRSGPAHRARHDGDE